MQHINYKEFYQKALIPIGMKDKKKIGHVEKGWRKEPLELTHCLIALEGSEENPQSEKYHWKVSAFPASSDGSFYSEKPFYTSEFYKSIHCAFEAARKLEEAGKCDQLFARYLH